MTPLEEKPPMSNIQEKINKIVDEYRKGYGDILPPEVIEGGCAWYREALESIATQAVEEYKKELLEKLPKNQPDVLGTYGSNDKLHVQHNIGFNTCLFQVKSLLINKSN